LIGTYRRPAFEKARDILGGVVHRTPVMRCRTLAEMAGCDLALKCENLQKAGAFKFRGAYTMIAMLTEAERSPGVITYSSGNHAQAVALAAKLFGTRAVIVMPEDARVVPAYPRYGGNLQHHAVSARPPPACEVGSPWCRHEDPRSPAGNVLMRFFEQEPAAVEVVPWEGRTLE
jgi:predicted alternative tryptophan synthase beta-subunit